MVTAQRNAEVVWDGDLASGSGKVDAGSGAFGALPISWASRTEEPGGQTSPEELIAAAHAGCYAMALSHTLAEAGNPPERLEVSAVTSFEPGKGVVSSNLTVRGRVPGLDAAGFEDAAAEGEQNCPVSNALRGNVEIRLHASLAE
jgi:osmotically inducible protein OsmC